MEKAMPRRIEDSTKIKLWRLVALLIAAAIGYVVWMAVMPSDLELNDVEKFVGHLSKFLMAVAFTTLATIDMFSRAMENHYYDQYLVEEDADEWLKSWTIAVGLTALLLKMGIQAGLFEKLASWVCTFI